jgi:hypothetical protein
LKLVYSACPVRVRNTSCEKATIGPDAVVISALIN